MVKQRCGTCRFFQESSLAGSGWCHHPQRRTTSDLLIMVRKNELACRDGWAHNLWEAGQFRDERGASDTEPDAAFAGRPMAPASEREIAALMQTGAAQGPEREDMVLSEIGLPPSGGFAPEPPFSATSRQLDPRSAIIRARENYRERRRMEVRPGIQPAEAPSRTTEADDPFGFGEESFSLRHGGGPLGTGAGHDDAYENEGRPADWTAIAIEPSDVDRVVDESEDDRDIEYQDDEDVDDDFGDDRGVDPDHPAGGLSMARGLFGGFGRFLYGYGRTTQPQRTVPDDRPIHDKADRQRAAEAETEDPAYRAQSEWDRDPEAEFDALVEQLGPTGQKPPSGPVATFGYRPIARRGPEPLELEIVQPAPEAVVLQSESVTSIDLSYRDEPFDDADDVLVVPSPDLAPELPRVCRTCRDFRPSESGGRGWCGNRWAFTHRRVVDAEDASPCESSFGSWWLPVDDAWSVAGDVSEHGRPTPLLDQWLPGHREEERQRRGS